MPTASQRILKDFFEHHLPFTPTPGQIEQFEQDLRLVSPHLMKAALNEANAGKALRQSPFTDRRAAIFKIYYRKVAEHAQLFPVFHTFETAFRSTVAVEIEEHYGQPKWWLPTLAALRKGDDARTVTHIHGVPISRDTANKIGQLVLHIEGDRLGRNILGGMADGYEFMELCDLRHISSLMNDHWRIFSGKYFSKPRPMALGEFKAKFKKVREARNDIYHHKSVAHLTGVVTAAEELLERLNCSVDFAYQKITQSSLSAPPFAIAPGGQHNLW